MQNTQFAKLLVRTTSHPDCPPAIREAVETVLSSVTNVVEYYDHAGTVALHLEALRQQETERQWPEVLNA